MAGGVADAVWFVLELRCSTFNGLMRERKPRFSAFSFLEDTAVDLVCEVDEDWEDEVMSRAGLGSGSDDNLVTSTF